MKRNNNNCCVLLCIVVVLCMIACIVVTYRSRSINSRRTTNMSHSHYNYEISLPSRPSLERIT